MINPEETAITSEEMVITSEEMRIDTEDWKRKGAASTIGHRSCQTVLQTSLRGATPSKVEGNRRIIPRHHHLRQARQVCPQW